MSQASGAASVSNAPIDLASMEREMVSYQRNGNPLFDPIRLVRMVKQITRGCTEQNLIHHPHEADGV